LAPRVYKAATIAQTKAAEEVAPDLAARPVIMAAYAYYVYDGPITDDAEYDKLCKYVADHWDELHPDQEWALGSPEANHGPPGIT
jgi:NAD-dependent DNA ligase